MLRTICVPESNSVAFPLPDEYVGKPLEVIIFPVEDAKPHHINPMRGEATFTDFGLTFPQGYKFDREEANAR